MSLKPRDKTELRKKTKRKTPVIFQDFTLFKTEMIAKRKSLTEFNYARNLLLYGKI